MQNWADGTMHTPTPLQMGSLDVAALAHGASRKLTLHVTADTLKSIRSWGAKPLLAEYDATVASGSQQGSAVSSQLHSYLTRSHDGLSEKTTPKITITTALPLTSPQRGESKNAIKNLVSDPAASTEVSAPSVAATKELNAEAELAQQHSSLRVIADPGSVGTVASALPQSSLSGIMQPYALDVTARAQFSDALWQKAGITDSAWNASAAHSLAGSEVAQSASTDSTATLKTSKVPAIAWESGFSWDSDSLALAAKQGYSTVIAESGTREAQSNVISGRQKVTTSEGDVTVLVAEQTLSQLAQGEETSDAASAETTQAGRLARFVAQSALFQMQRPYVSRALLVSFGDDPSVSEGDGILTALEDADWVKQGKLTDLTATTSDKSDKDSSDLSPDVAPEQADFTLTTLTPTQTQIDDLRSSLAALTETTTTINRLMNAVLKKSAIQEDTSSDENTDPQALSRQDAKKDESDQVTALQWLAKLRSAHQSLGLMSFGPTSVRATMLKADERLSSTLVNSVSVIPPSQINVFSASAQTPATVKNALPFPVSIEVDARTDSNAISITKSKSVDVNAGSETQATFTIHVVGTGSATATFSPIDRSGKTFGTSPSTVIYSQLTLNDMSGNVLIILALLLGAIGIYRQATRRKDPDQ
jgi:hypothetical protein